MRNGYREPCDVAANVRRQPDDRQVAQRQSFRSVIRSTATVFAMTLTLGAHRTARGAEVLPLRHLGAVPAGDLVASTNW
jgi:hypothetical protein